MPEAWYPKNLLQILELFEHLTLPDHAIYDLDITLYFSNK